jgi:hypothetical protein
MQHQNAAPTKIAAVRIIAFSPYKHDALKWLPVNKERE